jgi:hypothetical protein
MRHCTEGFNSGVKSLILVGIYVWVNLLINRHQTNLHAYCVTVSYRFRSCLIKMSIYIYEENLNVKMSIIHMSRKFSPAAIMGSNPTGGMDVCLLCVLSGRGLCDGLITRPEESCRLARRM